MMKKSKQQVMKLCPKCGRYIYLLQPGTHDCLENPFYAAKQVVKAMSQGDRNKILSLMHAGLSIGEVVKQTGVNQYQVSEIILMNTKTTQYLRSESL